MRGASRRMSCTITMTDSFGFMREAFSRLYFADRCDFSKAGRAAALTISSIILLECAEVLWFC